MKIDVFSIASGSSKIGCLTVSQVMVQQGTPDFYQWILGISPPLNNIFTDILKKSGLYEWKIFIGDTLSGHYVGKTRMKFKTRMNNYWQEMTPQLIAAFNGVQPAVRSSNFTTDSKYKIRVEKSPLRLVHLWLAWAYLNSKDDVRVELHLEPHSNSEDQTLDQKEQDRIDKFNRPLHPLLNRQANIKAGLGSILKTLNNPSNPTVYIVPPLLCDGSNILNNKAWENAFNVYGQRRKDREYPFP